MKSAKKHNNSNNSNSNSNNKHNHANFKIVNLNQKKGIFSRIEVAKINYLIRKIYLLLKGKINCLHTLKKCHNLIKIF